MKFATRAVRAGITPDPSTGSIVPPIYQTATYVLDEIGKDKGFDYTRSSNPTRAVLEANVAALENGKYAVSFASGMSAVDAVARTLSAGDHVVATDDVYGGVTRLYDQILKRFGVEISYVDTADPENIAVAIRPNTKLLWLETPTNPLLKITDLEVAVQIAKEHGLLSAVDSTFATPYLLRPLDLGIDLVVHSATKYLSGHNQVIGGIAITNDQALFEQLKFVQKSIGAVSSPFDCWLTLLGLKTLHLRMEKHSESGMAVAQYLEGHPKVKRVIYPGLPSHPGHEVAKRQMKAFSGIITFELVGDVQTGINFMNAVKLCSLAESLGAVETMVTHPATMTHTSVPREVRYARGLTDSLVRLSVGIEDVEDIIADLDQALARA
ncbi:MAG TPA: PLP-dependent aspartate aminotransferase family protein [Anaerolineales bacterium]|nr:PLP-dependent aspartate aminotransferase family protein [Anaerolineales bacterium]